MSDAMARGPPGCCDNRCCSFAWNRRKVPFRKREASMVPLGSRYGAIGAAPGEFLVELDWCLCMSRGCCLDCCRVEVLRLGRVQEEVIVAAYDADALAALVRRCEHVW